VKRSAIGVLFLTVVIDLLGFGIVLPLLPRYAETYKASGGQIGLLFASFSAMQFLFAPVWGRLSDRFGRRPLILLGLSGSVVSYLLFAFADSYSMLLISRIAAGVFAATIGTAQAYIADVTGHADRAKQMALIGAAFGLGFTLGPSIGGLAHHYLGVMAPGFIAAGLSLTALVFAVRALPEPERHVSGVVEVRLIDWSALRHAFTVRTVPLILLLQVIATFCFSTFEGTLALLTGERYQAGIRENGFLFTYVGIWLLLSQGFLVRRYMKRVGELRFTVGGSALLGLGLLAIAVDAAPALVVLPIAVLGFSMLSPSLSALLSLRTPQHMQGEILGLGQSGLALARIFGPWVGNVLFAVGAGLPYWVAAGIMCAALLGAVVLMRAPVPVPVPES